MNLLSQILGRRDRQTDRKARRPRLAIEHLEDRKVLSGTYGTFEGMSWEFVPASSQHAAELIVVDKPGNHRIAFQDQYDGNDGVQHINGLTWVDQNNNLQGGVNFTPGTQVNIVLRKGANENTFVNFSHQTMTTLAHSQALTTTQTGTLDGMAWKYTYAPSSNTGVLTLTSVPGSSVYDINFHEGTASSSFNGLTFTKHGGRTTNGPSLADLARVKIQIRAEVPSTDVNNPTHYEPGDNQFVDKTDFGTGYGVTVTPRLVHSAGTWEGMKYDLVSDPTSHSATLYWVNKPGTSRIYFQPQYDNNDMNPQINGIQWANQSTDDGGGVNFPSGTSLSKVKIVLIQRRGDNTFVNGTSFTLTPQAR